MNKIFWFIFFFFLFAASGYCREFFFVKYNLIMYEIYFHTKDEHSPTPPVMLFFTTLSYARLYYLKYFFTVFFVSVFFAMNYFAIKIFSKNTATKKLFFVVYGIVFVIAVLSMAYGYFINDRLQNDEYTLSRWLMGVAQSPVICLILLASEKLNLKINQPEIKKTKHS